MKTTSIYPYLTSGFRGCVNEILALLGCYAAHNGTCRRFGTTSLIFQGQVVQEEVGLLYL